VGLVIFVNRFAIFAKGFAKITIGFTKNVSRRAKNVIAPAKQAIRIFCNNQGSFALAKVNSAGLAAQSG
jgi:hypothetical protein